MLKLETALQHNILYDCGHMQHIKIKANIYIKKLTYEHYLHPHMFSALHNHKLNCKEQWYEFRAE